MIWASNPLLIKVKAHSRPAHIHESLYTKMKLLEVLNYSELFRVVQNTEETILTIFWARMN